MSMAKKISLMLDLLIQISSGYGLARISQTMFGSLGLFWVESVDLMADNDRMKIYIWLKMEMKL